MVQSAYDPEAYYPEAADALRRISAMEGSAMREFNANIPKIQAENQALMTDWQKQVDEAEARRQAIIRSQGRGKKSGVLPAIGGTILAGPLGGYAAYKTSRSL